MSLKTRLLGGYCVKNTGDTVRDIVLDYVAYKQRSQEYTYNRKHKVHPVERVGMETRREQLLYLVYERVQKECGYRGEEADEESQDYRSLTITKVLDTPLVESQSKTSYS